MIDKQPARGVIYQISKTRHAAVLVCSVASLRNHWRGPVQIIAGCFESQAVAEAIAGDDRLCGGFSSVEVVPWKAPLERGAGYANKTLVRDLCHFRQAIFLDADTLVVGSLGGLFPTEAAPVVLTQFADWWSTGKRIKGRTEKWRHVAPELVELSQRAPGVPAVNTGVFGFDRDESKPWFDEWRDLTHKNVSFICDEIAAQLLVRPAGHGGVPVRVVGPVYNASPIYPGGEAAGVKVWHFHGKKHLRREAGRRLWVPWLEAAMAEDWAGIRGWEPAGLGDPSLRSYLADPGKFLAKYSK